MPGPAEIGGEVGRRHLFMGLWQQFSSTGNLGGPGLDVGDHIACNVVVFEEGDSTIIAALDPTQGFEQWASAEAEASALSAAAALRQALRQASS